VNRVKFLNNRYHHETPLNSNLKVIAVPVLATILHTTPLIMQIRHNLIRYAFCIYFQ